MLSVVIPAYNEEKAIASTIAEVRHVLKQANMHDFEIIVVDDGSSDQTFENAKACGVKVMSHPHNVGYGRSLKDGIQAAQYQTIVITDADQTYPFQVVPDLLKRYYNGFDMVVGARTGKYYRESWLKAPLRLILKFLVEFTAGRKIPDINSGLRIFNRESVQTYFPTLCNTFSFTTSLTLAYMMTGRFVDYVPISYQKRTGRSKVKLFRDSLKTLQYILQAMNYYNPLKVFILFFWVCVFLSGIGFCFSMFLGFRSGFLLGIGGLLVSLLILGFGLIADLLKQILDK